MKKLFLPAVLAILMGGLGCSGCDDGEKTAPVNVVFKATFGDEPLVSYKKYAYAGGNQVFFNLFQYFISDVELVRADGSGEKLTDIDFVSLTFDKDADAAAGKALTFEGIPEGQYTGIRLGIGVSETLNATNPNSLPDSSPLTVNSRNEHWSGWHSYIFLKIEGSYDANGDGIAFEKSLTYHCGSNPVYRTLTLSKPITVSAAGSTDIELTADVAKMLRDAGQPLDLVAFPRTSDDAGDIVVATKLMDNLPDAIKIK